MTHLNTLRPASDANYVLLLIQNINYNRNCCQVPASSTVHCIEVRKILVKKLQVLASRSRLLAECRHFLQVTHSRSHQVCRQLFLLGFPRLLETPGFFLENSRTWKVLENHFGPGKSWKLKLKVLESHGKISLKVVHFSSGSNGKQAAIV